MLLSDMTTFIALLISDLFCISSGIIIYKKISKSQIRLAFLALSIAMIICCTGLLLQDLLSTPLGIPPIYFDYFVYIGNCLLPLSFFFTALIFTKTKISFSKGYLFFLIVPIISLVSLWTNDLHHLFYVDYSINLTANVYGPMFYLFDAFTLILFALGIILFLKQTISSSGVFSVQSLLMILGCSIPLIQNILSTTKIINTTIYITPICFTFTLLFTAIAVFKFKFLKSTPVSLRTIVDRISDSYIVLNDNYIISDVNDTFLHTFKTDINEIINTNILDFPKFANYKVDIQKALYNLKKVNKISADISSTNLKKTFTIEFTNIYSKDALIGILVLLRDTTQHTNDMNTIKNNQDMLIERERLASLGQMIGGIAHNLKTPIMSVAGAVEGLNDLVVEYEKSVGDPEVTVEDHHAIASDMKEWLEKIKTHVAYMSDVITAVKGQAVTFSEDQLADFSVDELLKMVNILMKHELSSACIKLEVQNNVSPSSLLHGNINSLVQVVNNIISNSIQASANATNKVIDLVVNQVNSSIIISIKDYGCGMPKSVQETLFKKMITTKGKNGTGLGMFMSYSNIKAHFNGDITFQSEEGVGTQFDIIVPIKNK